MNMGVTNLTTYNIDPEYNPVVVDEIYAEENETPIYMINGEAISNIDEYDAAVSKVTEPEFGGTKLYVEYNDLLPYYPYVCDERLKDAFNQMYEQLLDEDYIAFTGYYNKMMDTLNGRWLLESGSIDTRNEYLSYNYEWDLDWNDGAEIFSEVTIDSDGVDILFSAYKNGDKIDCDLIDLNMWNMKEEYYNNGIADGLDYGWSVRAVPEDYTDWEIYMCTDDEGKLRVFIFRYPENEIVDVDGHPIGEYIDLTYTKAFDTEGYSSVQGFLERVESEDKDGMKAYKVSEFLFINPDTPEDIKIEYGYPADYDDYEFERSHKEPYIIYVDENTDYTLIDWKNIVLDHKATYKNFEAASDLSRGFRIYFETMAGAEDYTGSVAVSVQEMYLE